MPKFGLALSWIGNRPELENPPELIITAGRKAAAVGKQIKTQLLQAKVNCKHIQILNPKDNSQKYDLLLVPEHDQLTGPNIINFTGSIHPYDNCWFKQNSPDSRCYMAILIGSPNAHYMSEQFSNDIKHIRNSFPNTPLYFCGSPRLLKTAKDQIRILATGNDRIWLDQSDGINPYEKLLSDAKKFFITSDSINMINECCQSQMPVSILADSFPPSPKHRRFIESIQDRINPFDSMTSGVNPGFALNQIKNHNLIKSLFN